MLERQLHLAFVDDLAAGRYFRTAIRVRAQEWELGPEVLEAALLLGSELLSNAVRHGSGPMHMHLNTRGGILRLAVRDAGALQPVMRRPEVVEAGGRGMRIVALKALAWGVSRHPVGKTVWCYLDTLTGRPAHEHARWN